MQDFFTVVGIAAVGIVLGYLITPLLFRAAEALAYLIAVMVVVLRARLTLKLTAKDVFNVFPQLLCKFHNCANKPNYENRNRESGIKYPQPAHKDQPFMEVRGGISIAVQPIAHTSGDSDHHPAKKDALNAVKCPAIIKVSNSIHTVLIFYRSFYGHSTKVEKNLLPGGLLSTVGR